jgi:hypothetical protein
MLSSLLDVIVYMTYSVERCVMAYLIMIEKILLATLLSLDHMVSLYIDLLREVSRSLTQWPCNIIVVMGVAVSGRIVIHILDIVWMPSC